MKCFFLFLLISCSVLSGFSQSIFDSLLLYYSFEPDTIDISGKNMHAQNFGGTPTSDRYGIPNAAIKFNGINQYMEMPNHPSLKIDTPFSITFWIYIDSFPVGTGTGIFCNDFKENYYSGIRVTLNPQKKLFVGLNDGGLVGSNSRLSKGMLDNTLTNNQWYHVAFIYKNQYDIDIYLDCSLVQGNYGGTGSGVFYYNLPGVIAKGDCNANPYPPPTFFNGKLDELGFWSRALSPNEIEEICNTNLVDIPESNQNSASSGNELVISPNPTTSYASIALKNNDNNKLLTVEVFNIAGQKILASEQWDGLSLLINCTEYPSGVYMVRCYNKNITYMKKMIIN